MLLLTFQNLLIMNNNDNGEFVKLSIDLRVVFLIIIVTGILKYFKVFTFGWFWVFTPVWIVLLLIVLVVVRTLIHNYRNR